MDRQGNCWGIKIGSICRVKNKNIEVENEEIGSGQVGKILGVKLVVGSSVEKACFLVKNEEIRSGQTGNIWGGT